VRRTDGLTHRWTEQLLTVATRELNFAIEKRKRNVTTLHLESGLTGSLVTINMADEGVAGTGKESGCGRGRSSFKNRVSHLPVHIL
jgi:hypothetical protein